MTRWLTRMVSEQFHRDTDDRPLREIRTPPELLRADDIEHKVCPYAGSRHHHELPMNVAALRQMSTHWAELIDALALVRTIYRDARPRPAPDVLDLWRVSQLAAALPWFYILRGDATTRAPAFAAGLAKATQGVGLWAQRVLVDALVGVAVPTTWTAQAIMDSTEANGTLIGEREVCAGPEAMMRRFFETLLAGEPALASAHVRALADARSAVQTFGAHYANLKLVLWLHALARQFLYADVRAALGEDDPRAAAFAALADHGCDPADFFLVGHADPAAIERPQRAAWMAAVATVVVSFAADGSDAPLVAIAQGLAAACGPIEPDAALCAEVAPTVDSDAERTTRLAQAIATFARIDALLADAAAVIEAGLRSTLDGGAAAISVDAAARDGLLTAPPRAALVALAPRWLAAELRA